MQLFLDAGADPNVADVKEGTPPLFIASYNRYLNVVKVLLNGGDLPNIATKMTGATSLHCAASIGYKKVLQLLLDKGAEPNVTNSAGGTPPHLAAFRGHKDEV